MPTLRAPSHRAASNVRSSSTSTTTRWKLAQMSAISDAGSAAPAPSAFAARPRGSMPVRSRTSRSTAVFSPLKLKSTRRATSGGNRPSLVGLRRVPIRVRKPRRREVARPIVAVAREPVDHRPSRIPEPEQLRHLVVRLSRRIVSRAADQAVGAGLGDQIQAGVPARHDEHGGRQRQLAVLPGRATRCGLRDDARARPESRAPRRTPSRTRHRRAASRRGRAPESPPRRRDPPSTRPPRPGPLRPRRRCRARAAGGELRHDAAPLAVDRRL